MKFSLKQWLSPIIAMASCGACLAHAETPDPTLEPPSTNSISAAPLTLSSNDSVWKDGMGNGFKKGAREIGMNISFAPGTEILGTRETHNLLFATAQMGWILSDVVMKDSPLRGNWEVLAEGFGGFQINKHAYLGGLDGFMRYYFITGTRVVPFFEAGAGVLATDIRRPELGSDFQFNEKAGIGAQFFITKHLAGTVEWRFMHISNAGIESPNHGVNTLPILLGVSYFF